MKRRLFFCVAMSYYLKFSIDVNVRSVLNFMCVMVVFLTLPLSMQAQTQPPIWNGTATSNWTGAGTENDPYLITTAEQLAGFAEAVNAGNDFEGEYIKLNNDLYMSDPNDVHEDKPQWIPIGGVNVTPGNNGGYLHDTVVFNGTFDGSGHHIYYIYHGELPDISDWDDPFGDGVLDLTGWYRGFFGWVENGTIKNLHLDSVAITGAADVGGLVMNNHGTIVDCSVSGVVGSLDSEIGGAAGAIAAKNYGTIERCSTNANVKGIRGVGGIAGYNSGIIHDCSATGKAYGVQYDVGGVVGSNLEGGVITNSHSSGEVGRAYYSYAIWDCGGFVGQNWGLIRECYSNANVVSDKHGAGFCGSNRNGRIESCYATGDVAVQGYSAIAATFVCANGQGSHSVYDVAFGGEIINCYATGKTINRDGSGSVGLYSFLAVYDDSNGWQKSRTVNCYSDADRNPYNEYSHQGYVGGAFRRSTAIMQSQAFVDTLNMFAALCGTSTWEYRENDYPVPTGIRAEPGMIGEWLNGGSGTLQNPYTISTKEQLKNFAVYVNHGWDFRDQYIRLENDIALNAPFEEWGMQAPTQWTPIGIHVQEDLNSLAHEYTYTFSGTFDGNFHDISNLYINTVKEKQGFFGTLGGNATVKNLGITDVWMKAGGASGILAGESARYASNINILQCHTSGLLESSWGAGGILGVIALEGVNNIYNCYSSAILDAPVYSQPVVADQNYVGKNDTIANFFYTAKIKQLPYSREFYINCYWNGDSTFVNDYGYVQMNEYGRTTAYMQSKEFVNELNYYVAQHNAQREEQLDYWQYTEGEYPTWGTAVSNHIITYNTNGGSNITPQPALNNSHILPPTIPEKEGYVFGGWFTDEAFTQTFDFDTTHITSDITLYAKWHMNNIEPDYTPFDNPFVTSYIINTKEQLLAFSLVVRGVEGERAANNLEGKTVKLGADILWCDTVGWQHWGEYAYGIPWTPVWQFQGIFDGNGYSISGLYFKDPQLDFIGFFGYAGENAEIKNVNIKASYFEGKKYVGALAGINRADISNCYVHANIKSIGENSISSGVLVGSNAGEYAGEVGGLITNCHAKGSIVGYRNVGGLIGYSYCPNETDTIKDCSAQVEIEGVTKVGGLIGHIENGHIYNSYATGNVTASNTVGGLVGQVAHTISHCYATGNINTRGGSVGGLAGNAGTITHCYATGNVVAAGNSVGGLAGSAGYITYCYATGNVQSENNEYIKQIGGLVGVCGDIDNSFASGSVSSFANEVGGLVGSTWGSVNSTHAIGNVSGNSYVGGLIGYSSNQAASATFSYATGNVNANGDGAGGLIGAGAVSIQKCFATGNVTAIGDEVGGLIGGMHLSYDYSTLSNCYAAGNVSGNNFIGGLAGIVSTVTNCYAIGNVTAAANVEFAAALIGRTSRLVTNSYYNSEVCSYTDSRATGMTTDMMHIKLYYNDWDFNDIWGRKDTVNNGYPYLRFVYDEFIEDDADNITHVTSVAITPSEVYLTYNQTVQLTAEILPSDATIKDVLWSSDNPNVAIVDANGLVTMKTSNGTTFVRATAVDGGLTDSCLISNVIAVSSVSIDMDEITLEVGESRPLTATVYPENATNKELIWYGSNENFSVTEDGVITGLQITSGRSKYVYVKTTDGSKFDNAKVTVIAPDVPVTGVTLNHSNLLLTEGQTERLTATITPDNATNRNVQWSSSNESVVILAPATDDGIYATIYAIGVGTSTIMVQTDDGEYSAICQITVTEADVAATSIVLDKDNLSLIEGQTVQLIATVLPENATDKTVIWSSNDTSVATVDSSGMVTAIDVGTTFVTATTTNDHIASCMITVEERPIEDIPATSVTLSESTLTLTEGQTSQLTATVLPENATDKTVTWSSNATAVATVDSDGMVTAVGVGTAVVTATTANGYSAFTMVTVEERPIEDIPVTDVVFADDALVLEKDEILQLIATVLPYNATDQSLTWSVSLGTDIVNVDQSDMVR